MNMDQLMERMRLGEPEFTGDKLLRLVIDIEAAVGVHSAAMTPLGRAVMELAEAAARNDPELKARDEAELRLETENGDA